MSEWFVRATDQRSLQIQDGVKRARRLFGILNSLEHSLYALNVRNPPLLMAVIKIKPESWPNDSRPAILSWRCSWAPPLIGLRTYQQATTLCAKEVPKSGEARPFGREGHG